MTTSNSATDLRGSKKEGFTTKRRQAGTSLVEILVVIVIFLIGILAVVQIFPRGFRLLLTSRNNSQAVALGRAEVEIIKSNPELLPEEILPVQYASNAPFVNTTLDPLALGPLGDAISPGGVLWRGSVEAVKNWMLSSGPNRARRIIGEGQRVPAPRRIDLSGAVGLNPTDQDTMLTYGGLLMVNRGPVATHPDPSVSSFVVYANDMSRSVGEPRETVNGATVTVEARQSDGLPFSSAPTFAGVLAASPVATAPFEFFVANADRPDASILFPATYRFDRSYRLRMSAYIGDGVSAKRYDYTTLCVRIPRVPRTASFVRVFLADLLANTPNAKPGGTSFFSAELETIRIAPMYDQIPLASNWACRADLPSSDQDYVPGDYAAINPFQVKVVNPSLGALLFSAAARQGVVNRPGGASEPLLARVDYDVYDWRIIREDFRNTGSPTLSLSLQSIKVGTQSGPDGRANEGLWGVSSPLDESGKPADNVLVIDLTTGFPVEEIDPATNRALVTVDKSRGSITFVDNEVTLLGLKNRKVRVPALNRTFRVLYRARNEWAIQLVKSASQYTSASTLALGAGQYHVYEAGDGGSQTRVYFPFADVNHKVTVDRITYVRGDGTVHTLEGQDFILRRPRNGDPTFAYFDVADLDLGATAFVGGSQAVRGVKGASVGVRVLWNPDSFTLGDDQVANIGRVEQWNRNWRPTMTETFLRAEETR